MNALKVMLIDDCRERSAVLESTLADLGHVVVQRAGPREDLYAACERCRPDIVIVDMESPDRDTLESMRSISERNPHPIVMFSNDDDSCTIQRAVTCGVTAYVVDGLNPKRVRSVIEVAFARFEQYQGLRAELAQARNSLADRKLVERAKGILMSRRQLDEPTAYRALQKMAMDRNMKIVDLARSLIEAAELLT